MPEYDPEERFSLYPMEGEDVLRKLLGADEEEGMEEAENTPEGDEDSP